MLKLLAAPDPLPALHAMQEDGVLAMVLPGADNFVRLAGLIRLKAPEAQDALLRLAALVRDAAAARAMAQKLKLSRADSERLEAPPAGPVSPNTSPADLRRMLYDDGRQAVIDRLLLADAAAPDPRFSALLTLARDWSRPVFPLSGRDALAAGFAPGPGIGAALSALEAEWRASDFALPRETLLARLKAGLG
jgi:tRNA nucleotidyltransferase/poly(A) polymerase